MRIRAVAIVATLVAGLAIGPTAVAAQPAQARLVVTGSHTASVAWHVAKAARVNIDTWWWRGPPTGTIRKAGHVGGVIISQGKRVILGVVQDGDLADGILAEPIIFGQPHPTLPAGDYTVTLVADGAVTVTLPLEGAAATSRLHPTKPAVLRRTSMSAMPAPPLPVIYAMTPVTVGPRTMVVVAYQMTSTLEQAQSDDECLSVRNEPCAAAIQDGSGYGFGGAMVGVVNTGSGGSGAELFIYPGQLKPGAYFGGVDQATIGQVNNARMVILSIDL